MNFFVVSEWICSPKLGNWLYKILFLHENYDFAICQVSADTKCIASSPHASAFYVQDIAGNLNFFTYFPFITLSWRWIGFWHEYHWHYFLSQLGPHPNCSRVYKKLHWSTLYTNLPVANLPIYVSSSHIMNENHAPSINFGWNQNML